MAGVHFTPEQESWLKEHYHSASSYDELTERFNQVFQANRKKTAIREKCTKYLGLLGLSQRTVWKTQYGNKEKEQLPIGTIRRSQVATYIKVKAVPPKSNISGYQEPYWLPLQKKVYQDAYGEIANGKMVCFLDGNTENFNLTNLYCIDRKISAVMSKNKWWKSDRDLTLTAIKWCELHYAIKEVNS